jgi:hypothetical protein
MSHVPNAMTNAAAHCEALRATTSATAASMTIVAALVVRTGCPQLIEREQREQFAWRSAGIEPLLRVQLAQVADHGGLQVAERGAEK